MFYFVCGAMVGGYLALQAARLIAIREVENVMRNIRK